MRKATLLKSQFNNRSFTRLKEGFKKNVLASLRSLRDFARECFCFGSEAVNASGEAVRGLVKSRFHSPLRFAAREIPRGRSPGGNMAPVQPPK